MTELLDLSCPVVRRGAGLHPDQTGRQLLEERQYLTSAQLAANDDHTLRVDTMNLDFARSTPIVITFPIGWLPLSCGH
jgi:hypothetical protein